MSDDGISQNQTVQQIVATVSDWHKSMGDNAPTVSVWREGGRAVLMVESSEGLELCRFKAGNIWYAYQMLADAIEVSTETVYTLRTPDGQGDDA